MSRRKGRIEHVKNGDRFVAYHLGEEIGGAKERGVMLSKVITRVTRTPDDNRGHVEFVPADHGEREIVYLVRKREGTVYVQTVNDVV